MRRVALFDIDSRIPNLALSICNSAIAHSRSTPYRFRYPRTTFLPSYFGNQACALLKRAARFIR